jgi:2-keto-4-pentenoate hydratase/2-oxohepta-3-ene-1,7-dioic acid hydratase in catechol pathway
MGIVRFQTQSGNTRCGYLAESSVIDLGEQPSHKAFDYIKKTNNIARPIYDRSDVTLLSPVDPKTVVRLDGCYAHDTTDEYDPHLGELATQETPSLWVAPTNSLATDENNVPLPEMTDDVRPGVELGLVISEQVRNCSPNKAREHIAGYTVCRTLTAHDEHPGLYGYRMFNGFVGVGSELVQEITLPVTLGVRRNGETADRASTTDLRFSLGELVSYASNVFTLDPGDLILTGNPVQIQTAVEVGEVITAWIESIGRQTTTIVTGEDT